MKKCLNQRWVILRHILSNDSLEGSHFDLLLEDGDFYRVGSLAHKMKPTIDMFDMIHLKELIRELEAESKNEDIDVASIREKVNFTVDRLNKIIQDLEQKFRG